MSEILRQKNDTEPTTESPKGGGVGAWLRNAAATLFGGGKAEKIPAWPGITLHAGSIEMRIEAHGNSGFLIKVPTGFISTSVTCDTPEEFAQMQETLMKLSDAEKKALAQSLRFSNHDDGQIDDMRGAAGLMQDAFYKICRKNPTE